MKKVLALSAMALAASAASAQSTVTIYGILDGGVTSVSGLAGGSARQVVSGIMDGSRIGFRMNEDLGGGWRALATLENRLEIDNGGGSSRPISGSQTPDRINQAGLLGLPAALQPVVTGVAGNLGSTFGVNLGNTFFDRQIFMGLVTPVGAILAGRQYTPAYEVVATFDTTQTQSALSFGQVASIPASVDIRQSNSLVYRIQQGGLTASAMITADERSTSTGRLLGVMGMYRAKAFSVGLGYNTRDNERGQKSLTTTVLGASFALGPGTLSAMVANVTDDNPTGISGIAASITPAVGAATAGLVQGAFASALRQDAGMQHIGYRMTSGRSTYYIAYSVYDDKRAANADTKSYGATYSYALSRRTDVNLSAVRMVNSGLGQAAPGGGGYLGGVTARAGVDSTALAVGARHRF